MDPNLKDRGPGQEGHYVLYITAAGRRLFERERASYRELYSAVDALEPSVPTGAR